MPKIAEFEGIRICIYAKDHNPPHFHAIDGEREVKIKISDLSTMAGSLSRARLRRVLEWANENRPLLAMEWLRLQGID